jgi:hypothetical protein
MERKLELKMSEFENAAASPETIEEYINQYIEDNFKYGDDGTLRKIRRGCFNGNGLLQPLNLDDLKEFARYVSQYSVSG